MAEEMDKLTTEMTQVYQKIAEKVAKAIRIKIKDPKNEMSLILRELKNQTFKFDLTQQELD